MSRVSILLIALLLSASACVRAPDRAVGRASEPLRDLSSVESAFLRLLNDYRVARDAPELMAERALNDGALQYSQRMGREGFFDHVAPDGSTFGQRMCDAGYDPGCGPTTFIGENLAAGQRSAQEVFDAWRMSPGHNANMLDARYLVVGIGRAQIPGSPFTYYWTNTFGGEVTAESVRNDAPPPGDAGPDAAGTPPPPPPRDSGCSVGILPTGAGGAPVALLGLVGLLALRGRRRR